MFDPKKILVLAPHTDDGELGCGASIAKFCAEKKEVFYAGFCVCSRSLPAGYENNTLEIECKNATQLMGIPPANLILYNYEVRELPASRQQVLEELLKLNKDIDPDLVLLPAASDLHQDHQVIHHEGLRAFKAKSMIGYELPWNNFSFKTDLFIRFGETELQKKLEALAEYRSQAGRSYMQEEFIRSLAKVRGVQSGADFAEAFELYRMIT